ncbi:cold-shock protein [Lachnoclostridium sp.]|uniref:cold-shock protein n=1 Tax=Lachnoclostridium sp. TaxID=2028282 RepID=UPI003FA5B6EB
MDHKKGFHMANYTGTVKWYDSERGYGFVSTNDGRDVFLHHSQIKEKGSDKQIHEGKSIEFDIIEQEKGPAAINVHKNS